MVMLSKLISMVYIMYQPLKIRKQLHGVQVKKDLVNSRMKSDIEMLFHHQVPTIPQIIPVANTCFPVLKIMELGKWCLINVAMTSGRERLCLRHQVQVHIWHQVNLDILKVTKCKWRKLRWTTHQETLIELLKLHRALKDHKSVMESGIAEKATILCITR